MTTEVTDAQLVGRCRAGEHEAWNELVERFSRYVYAIAVPRVPAPEHDARGDVFQGCSPASYERLDSLRDDTAIRPWLAQLTRNACVDRLRSGAREQPAELPEGADADGALERLDEALDVHEGLRALSGTCREMPRPLLRPRDELSHDRRRARAAGGHDRQPDLPLPGASSGHSWRQKSGPGIVWGVVKAQCPDTTRSAWASCWPSLPLRPPRGSRPRRSCPWHATSSTRSSSVPRQTWSFASGSSPTSRPRSPRQATVTPRSPRRCQYASGRARLDMSPLQSTLRTVLDEIAGPSPAPGAGAVSGVVTAMAAGLIASAARRSSGWEDARGVSAPGTGAALQGREAREANEEAYLGRSR